MLKALLNHGRALCLYLGIGSCLLMSCGQDYKDISSEEGRRYVLDETNKFLTSGLCQQSKDILSPLYNSAYVDNEIRITYAAVYACFGGFNFPKLVGALINAGSDIWSGVVASN